MANKPLYATVDARVLSVDDDDLSAEVTFGKLGVENNNGWILAEGVTGGRTQSVSLSDFNHSLGSPFSASGPPVGVGAMYEADGELRLKPKWNPDMQAGREAHSAVKFAYENGAPLQWSYGGMPTEIVEGGKREPYTVMAADFFEASPVLRGAHNDATTLAASRILAASNQTQEGEPMPEGTDTGGAGGEGTVEVRPLYDLDVEELAGKIGQKFEGALETLTAAADSPKFQAQEKEIGELRERIRQIENTPAAAEQFAAMGGGNPIENAWAAGKHDWEAVKKQASGNGVYVAQLDIDPRALFAATVTTATGVTGLPERVGYDFTALGRIGLTQMLPTFPTGATSVRFQRETIATAARPAPTAEAAASPEANIAYADQDRPIEHIRGLVPVTEQELDDQPFMQSLISGRMGDLVQANLENQVLQGSGTTPNLTGINGTSSVQTATAAYNATARTRVVNFLTALGVVAGLIETNTDIGTADIWVMPSSHFWLMAAATDASARPIFPELATTGQPSIFGIAIARSGGQHAARQTVISRAHIELRVNRGLTVEIGYNGTDFSTYQRSVRAGIRAALVVRRPQAMALVTAANS